MGLCVVIFVIYSTIHTLVSSTYLRTYPAELYLSVHQLHIASPLRNGTDANQANHDI
jgi:hypothetical protein